jgi:hypothetical protein
MLCCGCQVTDEDVAAIEELGRQGGLFERLAASIAPEIFGMLDVKKVRLALYYKYAAHGTWCLFTCYSVSVFGMLGVKMVRGS